jgi:hypothetical protein
MPDINGKLYIVYAHEAVYNKGSNTSLLSEFQMREYGLIVDTIPERHTNIDGKQGTQQIYIPHEDVTFKLYITSALMTCPHRSPTDEEIASLPSITITSPDEWNPHDHTQNDEYILPLNNNIADAYINPNDETYTFHAANQDDKPTTNSDIDIDSQFAISRGDITPTRIIEPLYTKTIERYQVISITIMDLVK